LDAWAIADLQEFSRALEWKTRQSSTRNAARPSRHEKAKRSPWATAWLLEQNFPKLYALREYGRLMLEFAQQNEAKTAALPAPETG